MGEGLSFKGGEEQASSGGAERELPEGGGAGGERGKNFSNFLGKVLHFLAIFLSVEGAN